MWTRRDALKQGLTVDNDSTRGDPLVLFGHARVEGGADCAAESIERCDLLRRNRRHPSGGRRRQSESEEGETGGERASATLLCGARHLGQLAAEGPRSLRESADGPRRRTVRTGVRGPEAGAREGREWRGSSSAKNGLSSAAPVPGTRTMSRPSLRGSS